MLDGNNQSEIIVIMLKFTCNVSYLWHLSFPNTHSDTWNSLPQVSLSWLVANFYVPILVLSNYAYCMWKIAKQDILIYPNYICLRSKQNFIPSSVSFYGIRC